MKKLASCSIAILLVLGVMGVVNSFASSDGVNWVYKGITILSDHPDLKHYVWETTRPPNGPWDVIALNRYIKESTNKTSVPGRPSKDKRKVLFLIPGTWDRGSHSGTDPNVSETWFFADNGYDVYTISFRTEYIPNYAYSQFSQFGLGDALTATRDWTYAVFREDIKACVDLAKKISGAKKVFLAGRSRGGTQMWIYAAKYGAQDLKGLISLDGGGPYIKVNPANQMAQEQFEGAMAAFRANGPYLSEVGSYELNQFAGAVPFSTTSVGGPLPAADTLTPPIPAFAPPDKSQIEFMSDFLAYGAYYTWGAGMVTDYYKPYPGGSGETYMDREVLVEVLAGLTRYWPRVHDVEGLGMANYTPPAPSFLDYNQTADLTLPIIFFGSDFGCYAMGACYDPTSTVPEGQSVQPRTASTDVTSNILHGYGHLDIYSGTHSLQDVKEPVLEWMNHRVK